MAAERRSSTSAGRPSARGGRPGSAPGARRWSEAVPAPVVVVTGGEGLLAERAVSRVRDLARAEHPDLEVIEVDASTYATGGLTLFASPSLFEQPRAILVSGVEAGSDAFVDDALVILADLPGDVVLLLRHSGGVRAKKLLEAAKAAPGAVHVDCPVLKSASDQRAFADGEFRASQRSIAPAALEALLLAVGNDLRALAAACAQLVSDVPAEPGRGSGRAGTQITEDDVERYYGGRAEVTGFKVADAAVAGHREEALRLLRQALESGLDPVPLVAALAAKLRAMVKVAAAGGGPDHEVARSLGMAPWQVQRARSDLRGWSPQGIAAGIIALAEADAAVKGAHRDPQYAVERSLITITGARR